MTLLRGKNAVITGGSDGIGLGIATEFARAGAVNLVLVGRDTGKLEAARKNLAAFPDTIVHLLTADLSEPKAIASLAEQIMQRLPQLDILVNNAGLGRFVPFAQMDEVLFDAHFNLNVKAPYFLTQALLSALTAAQGNVINISSYFAHRMLPDRATTAYSATKGALNAFTKALAFEIGHLGIRVNAIAPGSIETAQLQHNLSVMPAERQEAFARMVKTIYPLGKIGSPADIGKTAAFLASDHAQWITGAIWPVDGGLTTN